MIELKIYARNIEIDSRANEYIQKKFERLKRHLSSLSEAKLEVSRTSARSQAERVVAQMTLLAKGRVLRGQERGLNLFSAIDAVADVMDRQIRRHKGKVYRTQQARRASRSDPAGVAGPQLAELEIGEADGDYLESGRVVRSKRFAMEPMTTEDAITQMELLSHQFFLFYNVDTEEYNVVYRRHDGDYGVIEPEMI